MQPKLIDNINNLLGDDLKEGLSIDSKLKIAASTFSIYAYESLKKELEKIDSLEFIFTQPTFLKDQHTDNLKKEKREFYIPRLNREKSLYGSEFEIQLKNKMTQKAIAKECARWIRQKTQFYSNVSKAPMQSFVLNQSNDSSTVYLPLNGFTAVDLGYQRGDHVSNYVNKFNDEGMATQYLKLFDDICKDPSKVNDITEELCHYIESVYQENSPQKIYFFILYNIFKEFLEDISEDDMPNDLTGYKDSVVWNKLYNFQKDAAIGIINKLEKYNGCILADSVGLGKTFTALAVIKYYELRNKSVLVLCPKKLADNWLNYNRNLKTNILAGDRLSYEVLCHTDLQRVKGESFGTPLNKVNWGNFDLVVIDESHNFRNNNAFKDKETRYESLMNKVIKDGVKTKVLMLSATPVNNRFNDLKNQLAIAYEGVSSNLSKHLNISKGIDEIFKNAQYEFNQWEKRPAEERTAKKLLDSLDFDFFELLDSVTIARSRKHIQKYYDTSEVGQFPERLAPLPFRPKLTSLENILDFNGIYNELNLISMSIYGPVAYIFPSCLYKYEDLDTLVKGGASKLFQKDREKSLRKLMTVNLLKRLESSVEAFRLTLKSLDNLYLRTLANINSFRENKSTQSLNYLTESLKDLDDEFIEDLEDDFFTAGKINIDFNDMDIDSWEADLKADQMIIAALLKEMSRITPDKDSKLQHLITQVSNKIRNPINPNNKKVIIFTAFADTADYIYDNVSGIFKEQYSLFSGKITGKSKPKSNLKTGLDFQDLLTLFSPKSKSRDLLMPDSKDELDILIATDCISEGQNLQDCDFLINYDIHWNPVRIIQRFGRIDRIGSKNKFIQLVNYWPDISLDDYINLKERVENRMVIADASATADDNVLRQDSEDIAYRKEQLRKLQDEVIDLEDVKTGVSITDLGLNDFRIDLLNFIKESNLNLDSYPTGIHTVVKANPTLGLKAGTIFVLKNLNPEKSDSNHNRLHPYYLVYVSDDHNVVIGHDHVKSLLDLIRTSCREQGDFDPELCSNFNEETKDGHDMSKYSSLLDSSIQSIINVHNESKIDSLFSQTKTVENNHVQGLEDFELLCFIVVKD
ncbi:MAG: helicase-related protein [Vampirovibrionia bacterium]